MSDETDKTAAAPAADTAAEVADEPKKIDADEPASEVKAEEPGDDKGEETDSNGEPKPKKPSGAQRAKAREEFLRNEIRERDRRLEELERQSKQAGGEKDDPPPKEEDFNGDWFAWQRALSAHDARKAVREEFAKTRQSELEGRKGDLDRERKLAHLDRVEEARESITDWDEVIGSAQKNGLKIHEDVLELIIDSDKSPLLSYHLAKNPDKLRELNSLSGRELAREIGRLEGSIRMPAGKKQTTAPPPPSNLKGGAAPHAPLEAVDDMNEFAKRLNEDLARRRGR